MEFENRKRLYLATKRSKDELHYAAYYGDLNTLQLLLRYYGHPMCNHRDSKGNTPIFTAIIGIGSTDTKTKMIESLMQGGASINSVNDDGSSVLHAVVHTVMFRRISNKIIRLLIDYGADRTITNNGGKTAAELSFELRNGKLGRLLLFYDPPTASAAMMPVTTSARREKKKKSKRSLGKFMKRLSLSLNNLSHTFGDQNEDVNELRNDTESSDETEPRRTIDAKCTALTTPDMTQAHRRRSFGGYSYAEDADKDLHYVYEGGARSSGVSRGSRYRRDSAGGTAREGPESGIFSICRISRDMDLGKNGSEELMESLIESDIFPELSRGQPSPTAVDRKILESSIYLDMDESNSKDCCTEKLRRDSEKGREFNSPSKGLCGSIEFKMRTETGAQKKPSEESAEKEDFDVTEIDAVEEENIIGTCRKRSLQMDDFRVENKYIDLQHDCDADKDLLDGDKEIALEAGEDDEKGGGKELENQKGKEKVDLKAKVHVTVEDDDDEPTFVDYTIENGFDEGDEKFAKTMTTENLSDDSQDHRASTEMLHHCSTMLTAVENLYLMTILKDKYKRLSQGSMGDSEC